MNNISTTNDYIKSYIDSLIRGNGKELDAYLLKTEEERVINNTLSKVRCYMICSAWNGLPRLNDLAEVLVDFLLDYSIPRDEIFEAKRLDDEQNTTRHTTKLQKKAKSLFTSLEKTGEPGEVLLYLLSQSILKLPQAIAKMPLKTSPQMHYHGADGVHLGFDENTQRLHIYWGEAKLYQDISSAVNKCFTSLAPFFDHSHDARNRDIQLLTSNLSLTNPDFEAAIINYLNPDHPNFNLLEYRGVCLIGFDFNKYARFINEKTQDEVLTEIINNTERWINSIEKGINRNADLNKITIEVFILPMPSVDKFRKHFLEVIKNG